MRAIARYLDTELARLYYAPDVSALAAVAV
jgi:hypothetical protein